MKISMQAAIIYIRDGGLSARRAREAEEAAILADIRRQQQEAHRGQP